MFTSNDLIKFISWSGRRYSFSRSCCLPGSLGSSSGVSSDPISFFMLAFISSPFNHNWKNILKLLFTTTGNRIYWIWTAYHRFKFWIIVSNPFLIFNFKSVVQIRTSKRWFSDVAQIHDIRSLVKNLYTSYLSNDIY